VKFIELKKGAAKYKNPMDYYISAKKPLKVDIVCS
jgi:hypothetical protein